MSGLLGGWRVSLRRTLADWPIVAAVWLITLLAAVLLAAGAIYPAAAAEAGLRRALTDASVGDANIQLTLYSPSGDAETMDAAVQGALGDILAPLGGSLVRDWRSSATLGLPSLPAATEADQALVGALDDLESHATLVAGSWPAEQGSPSEPIQVVVLDAAATALPAGGRRRAVPRRPPFEPTRAGPGSAGRDLLDQRRSGIRTGSGTSSCSPASIRARSTPRTGRSWRRAAPCSTARASIQCSSAGGHTRATSS